MEEVYSFEQGMRTIHFLAKQFQCEIELYNQARLYQDKEIMHQCVKRMHAIKLHIRMVRKYMEKR